MTNARVDERAALMHPHLTRLQEPYGKCSGHFDDLTPQESAEMDAVVAALEPLAAEATKLRAAIRSVYGVEAPVDKG